MLERHQCRAVREWLHHQLLSKLGLQSHSLPIGRRKLMLQWLGQAFAHRDHGTAKAHHQTSRLNDPKGV